MIGALLALGLNAAVTQATIDSTVCVGGYASTYRRQHPPQLATKAGYVVDHIVSLELGGSSDRSNLQYQTIADGKAKDRVEDQLHREVCAHRVKLRAAQRQLKAWRPR